MRLSRMGFRLFEIDTEIQKYRSYARLIESFLQTKKSELIQVAEQLPEGERSEFLDHYYDEHFELAVDFPTVLRYSVFTQAYSFLEHTLLNYCNISKEEFALTISQKDLAGNGIEKFQTYLKKVANIQFPDDTEAWKTIKGYNVIRNCIAHTLGDVTDMNNATKLRSVISEMENIEINDSKISLGEKFCFKALNNIQDFLHDLEESYMKRKSLQS